ncbi:hypothetical protein [Nonomuraea angiospora]
MNGLGLPTAQPTVRELREQLALAEACEPISSELQDAKEAYRQALESGDPAAIGAAKERKQAAAHHINETRTWLRREARIAKLQTLIPDLQTQLAEPAWQPKPGWTDEERQARADMEAALAAMEAELPALEEEAAPLRELFGSIPQAGPPIVVEDGSAAVDMPVVKASAKAMKGGR